MLERPKLSTIQETQKNETLLLVFGLPVLVAHGVPTVLIEAYVHAKMVYVLEQTFKSAINPHISIVLYTWQTHLLVLSRLRDDIRSFFPVALTSWSEKKRRKAYHSPDES